jgi:hypothetical protein
MSVLHQAIKLNLQKDIELNVELTAGNILNEVTVRPNALSGRAIGKDEHGPVAGSSDKECSSLLGEKDVQSPQLMPESKKAQKVQADYTSVEADLTRTL